MPRGYKIIDKGWNDLVRFLGGFTHRVASVGIQGDEAEESHGEKTNVQIAVIHEFGAPAARVPERSFIRSTFDENRRGYQRRFNKLAKTVYSSRRGRRIRFEGGLLLIGELFRRDVLRHISKGILPGLKPATIARKKGDTLPLVDTGQMRGSMTTVIRDKNR